MTCIHIHWTRDMCPPVPACACRPSGCVVAPENGESFGFAAARWAVSTLGVLLLLLFSLLGHEIEVVIGIAAAVPVAAVIELLVRRVSNPGHGGTRC